MVAATMEKQAVASGEFWTKKADTPEQRKNSIWLYFFFCLSVGLAVLFPIALRCSGRDTLIAVWRLSLLFCSYFYSAVCVLSPDTRKRKARLLVYLTYAVLSALVVDAVLSHAAGTVIIYLDSVWIAGVFGHALAEHRVAENPAPTQEAREELARELGSSIFLALVFSVGALPLCTTAAGCSFDFVVILTTELYVLAIVAVCIVFPKHRDSEKAITAKESLAGQLGLIIFLALVFSACGFCPQCIIIAAHRGALLLSPPLEVIVVMMPMVVCLCIPIIVICTLNYFRRGEVRIVVVVLGVECDTRKVWLLCYFSSFMLFNLNFLLVTEVGVVIILGSAVFFGYCSGIYPWFLVRYPYQQQLIGII
ncbi:hypothetical protein ACQ4PT_005177 [Festuca glaucescens]